MIKVVVNNENIKISGHANYADYGNDIVCSSVSSISTTSINAIIMFSDEYIDYIDDSDQMIITPMVNNEITTKLLENMLLMLRELEQLYPKNIKIIEMRENK